MNYKNILGVVIVIACIAGIGYYVTTHDYVSFATLQTKSAAFKQAVAEHYVQSVLIYSAAFAGIMMIGIPISGVLTLIGGYLFGLVLGSVYALLSSTAGVVLSFIFVRYAVGSLLQARYQERLAKFREKFKTHGASYLLTLYLLMVVPYIVIIVLAALAEVPLRTFAWTTLVGSMPLTFMYALAGQQLGSLSSAQHILSPQMIGLLIVLILCSLAPLIIQKIRHRYEA